MLALIKVSELGVSEEILSTCAEGSWIVLPNGDYLSPAQSGWSGGGLSLVEIEEGDSAPDGFFVKAKKLSLVHGVPKFVNEFAPEIDASSLSLTSRQFWIAALEMGITKSSLREYVESNTGIMFTDYEAESIKVEIDSATSFERSNRLIVELSALQGIEPYQLDAMWLRAASF